MVLALQNTYEILDNYCDKFTSILCFDMTLRNYKGKHCTSTYSGKVRDMNKPCIVKVQKYYLQISITIFQT